MRVPNPVWGGYERDSIPTKVANRRETHRIRILRAIRFLSVEVYRAKVRWVKRPIAREYI